MAKKIKAKIKKKSKKKNNTYLNLMVADGKYLKLMKLKRVYSKAFIKRFGLVNIPFLNDFLDFKEKMKKTS